MLHSLFSVFFHSILGAEYVCKAAVRNTAVQYFARDLRENTAVIATAMDMNASYNQLVAKHLPNAQIVYDRLHMQAQFGREVLGVVRLNEAQKHNTKAKEILADIGDDADKETKKSLKQTAKAEKREYSQLKKLRWTLLANGDTLSERKKNICELSCKIITTSQSAAP